MDGGDPRLPDSASSPPDPSPSGGDAVAEQPEGAALPADRSERCDALARAISATLGTVMREFEARADGAAQSQEDLAVSIDRLTGELDKLLEDAPVPFIMQHAAKISSIRKRVSALNLMLKSIQRRVDNIDRMLSTGVRTDSTPQLDTEATSSFTL